MSAPDERAAFRADSERDRIADGHSYREATYQGTCRCGTDLFLEIENTAVRVGLTPRIECPSCSASVYLTDETDES